MKRPLRPEEHRLWSVVTATVRPAASRKARLKMSADLGDPLPTPAIAAVKVAPPPPGKFVKPPKITGAVPALATPLTPKSRPAPSLAFEPDRIEPNRHRRIVRERDLLSLRVDLHGLDQDRARRRLIDFLLRAQEEGERAVLVITGKGALGEGVLRRRTPDWLAEPMLREVVAGVSPAHRRHGGEGALYVALKRRR